MTSFLSFGSNLEGLGGVVRGKRLHSGGHRPEICSLNFYCSQFNSLLLHIQDVVIGPLTEIKTKAQHRFEQDDHKYLMTVKKKVSVYIYMFIKTIVKL